MIIINDEILAKAFGELRVKCGREEYSWSVEELSKRGKYGDGIKYLIIYDGCSDPQKYVDNWMNSTIAKTEVAEYYKDLSFKGEDNMNKYETLLKKYQALYKDFEAYREVTEGIATNGCYIKNEALEELLEYKKKYDTLFKEHTVYCSAAEDVTVKLIETEKKYYELKNENDVLKEERGTLIKEGCYLHDVIEKRQEKYKRLRNERDGFEKENAALIKERDDLVKEVYYLHEVINEKNSKCKEKMDKIKQRDKQITEYIRKNNVLKEERDCLLRKIKEESNESEKQVVDLIKERDELKQRLEHINVMSNLEWKFEVVEETETGKSSYDTLVQDEKVTKAATAYDELVSFCENRRDGGKDCFGCPNEIACDGINPNFRPAKWNENQKEDYNELIAMVKNKED